MGLNEELEKARNFTGFALVCALLVLYGGTTIPYGEGTWFYFESEYDATDDSEAEYEAKAYYTIEEVITEGERTDQYGTSESLDYDGEYSDYGFSEREDIMELTKNLALVSLLLVGALFAFIMGLFTGQFEKEKTKEYLDYAKNACLGLIVICLLNAGNFALNYSEAWQKDTDEVIDDLCGLDDDEDIPAFALFVGGCENKATDQIVTGTTGDFNGIWHPGPAWLMTFTIIPGIAALEYFRLKGIDETGALSEYKPAVKKSRKRIPQVAPPAQPQQIPVVPAMAIPEAEVVKTPEAEVVKTPETKKKTKTPKKKPLQKFKPKVENIDIECPSCSAVMSIPKLDKLQDVKCEACGLSGEIEI